MRDERRKGVFFLTLSLLGASAVAIFTGALVTLALATLLRSL